METAGHPRSVEEGSTPVSETAIVVGVDGSETADHALAWARERAGRTGAHVYAVMGWDVPPFMFSPSPMGVPVPPIEVIRDTAKRQLAEAVERAGGEAGSFTAVLREEGPVAALLEEAKDHDADLIVVGTRGLGPVKRLLLGSVSSRVTADAPCPVAVVPDGAPVGPAGPVVVGVDGSEGSVAALRWAAAETDAPIHAIYAISYPFGPVDPVVEPEFTNHEDFGRQVVEQTVALALGDDTGRVTAAATGGDARDVLIQVVEALDASLLVTGARGAKGLTGIGSVPTAVMAHSRVPVVVVPTS